MLVVVMGSSKVRGGEGAWADGGATVGELGEYGEVGRPGKGVEEKECSGSNLVEPVTSG